MFIDLGDLYFVCLSFYYTRQLHVHYLHTLYRENRPLLDLWMYVLSMLLFDCVCNIIMLNEWYKSNSNIDTNLSTYTSALLSKSYLLCSSHPLLFIYFALMAKLSEDPMPAVNPQLILIQV